jgi:hypothetical protein
MASHLRTSLATILIMGGCTLGLAQINTPGRFHLGIGLAAAGHATEYTETIRVLGIPFERRTTDGAATVTIPLEFSVGVVNAMSLGLYLEPGSYLDSSATESNGLALIGVQPRFYLVNKDRFAWTASLRLGGSALQIDRNETGLNSVARYRGGHLGLGTGIAAFFTDHIGLQVHLFYLANRFNLKEYELNGASLSLNDIDAELRTRGVGLQASLAFRF